MFGYNYVSQSVFVQNTNGNGAVAAQSTNNGQTQSFTTGDGSGQGTITTQISSGSYPFNYAPDLGNRFGEPGMANQQTNAQFGQPSWGYYNPYYNFGYPSAPPSQNTPQYQPGFFPGFPFFAPPYSPYPSSGYYPGSYPGAYPPQGTHQNELLPSTQTPPVITRVPPKPDEAEFIDIDAITKMTSTTKVPTTTTTTAKPTTAKPTRPAVDDQKPAETIEIPQRETFEEKKPESNRPTVSISDLILNNSRNPQTFDRIKVEEKLADEKEPSVVELVVNLKNPTTTEKVLQAGDSEATTKSIQSILLNNKSDCEINNEKEHNETLNNLVQELAAIREEKPSINTTTTRNPLTVIPLSHGSSTTTEKSVAAPSSILAPPKVVGANKNPTPVESEVLNAFNLPLNKDYILTRSSIENVGQNEVKHSVTVSVTTKT